jgi:hypothetical protein
MVEVRDHHRLLSIIERIGEGRPDFLWMMGALTIILNRIQGSSKIIVGKDQHGETGHPRETFLQSSHNQNTTNSTSTLDRIHFLNNLLPVTHEHQASGIPLRHRNLDGRAQELLNMFREMMRLV